MARVGGFSSQRYPVAHVATMCGGFVMRQGSQLVEDVQIDSRLCSRGSLFFALPGAHADGVSYVGKAALLGCSAVVVSHADTTRALEMVGSYPCAVIAVRDTLSALQTLAREYRKLFAQVTAVGITGSCGKSTTKEAIAAITSTLGNTVKTPGNLNSEIGLPLSILQLQGDTRYGIFELGIDHVGEMDRMVSMLKPDIGLLTNIGISHLEKFNSRATILAEKGKLFHPAMQMGFVSEDCPFAKVLEMRSKLSLKRYGMGDIQAVDKGLDGWDLTFEGERFHVNCVGKHLLSDVFGAIQVGLALGADKADIAQGLEGFLPMQGRSYVHKSGVTIIDDSYNASLDSTTSILGYLAGLKWKGSKKVVLGSMKELGKESRGAHAKVARQLFASPMGNTYLYGPEMKGAYDLLRQLGYASPLFYTDDFSELEQSIVEKTRCGDLYLLKASRSMAMERLIPSISQAG
ncbi:UDP-N-acetylmuramoyl-tripeptide--D-alanyl-D-alanine ligase [Sphaerochaeta sp. PS]|uniref:UDP-N-acetylmuramoyl-tripeptide--D-alanyl-D- alanine ligase n=1 Tax=Sphaerochaeta sp. PS TaxID=3076336 RepID=UPI0028A39DD3|nr:UDP-N-acetylmuramoyl-tripeptide--D-alanyl-D-alanine ligase [Sphaerochaeta sp. PS]MDT4762917.1 UDP-N-acetylmuramoyl-tripeptide--D-alanyl-D-alanine ligase [Sphaerochaeta sp. PS]